MTPLEIKLKEQEEEIKNKFEFVDTVASFEKSKWIIDKIENLHVRFDSEVSKKPILQNGMQSLDATVVNYYILVPIDDLKTERNLMSFERLQDHNFFLFHAMTVKYEKINPDEDFLRWDVGFYSNPGCATHGRISEYRLTNVQKVTPICEELQTTLDKMAKLLDNNNKLNLYEGKQ